MPLPLVGAAVVLCLAGCDQAHRTSSGFMLDLAKSPERCGDGRYIVADAIGNHRVRLSSQPDVAISETGRRLREMQRYRAVKLVFVKAEAGVPWGEFVELVDRVKPESDMMSWLTPQVEALARERICLTPSCGQCQKLLESGAVRR
ncbi:MAG: hypothetical protein ABSH50_16255 [Bryobacteraceae bacterium]